LRGKREEREEKKEGGEELGHWESPLVVVNIGLVGADGHSMMLASDG
jgi:hypothetical protein